MMGIWKWFIFWLYLWYSIFETIFEFITFFIVFSSVFNKTILFCMASISSALYYWLLQSLAQNLWKNISMIFSSPRFQNLVVILPVADLSTLLLSVNFYYLFCWRLYFFFTLCFLSLFFSIAHFSLFIICLLRFLHYSTIFSSQMP